MDFIVSNSQYVLTRVVELIKSVNPANIIRNAIYKPTIHPQPYAIPPSLLIVQVAGNSRIEWFLGSGEQTVKEMMEILESNNISLGTIESVLDFGCGCGRLLRHLPKHINCRIYGTDYNYRAVKWCNEHLPFANVSKNLLRPPFSYSNNQFDFVYGISVLTHHSEQLQCAWIEEIHRILRPGGHVLLTIRGNAYREQLNASELCAFDRGEYVVQMSQVAGTNFCNSYHPESYFRKMVAGRFVVLSYLYAHKKFKPRPVSLKSHPCHDVVLLMAK